jgi:hypothetical protein
MLVEAGAAVNRSDMRRLASQARGRFGREHELVAAALKAETTMAPDDIARAIQLLDTMEGISGRHLRTAYYRR